MKEGEKLKTVTDFYTENTWKKLPDGCLLLKLFDIEIYNNGFTTWYTISLFGFNFVLRISKQIVDD